MASHAETTGFCQKTKVKQQWDFTILRWVMTSEKQVL